jgi:dihydrofolate reductase
MRRLTSIVAVNQQGAIGCRNALPWRLSTDMRFFKETTTDNVVIMGRKTHDSLGRCLPNRYNVVLSHQLALFQDTDSCVLKYSIAEALEAAETCPKKFGEIFVIGGETMYRQFAPFVDRYLITVVDKVVPDADAFFSEANVGDERDWNIKLMLSVEKDETNEAPFKVFEFVSRDAEGRAAERADLISGWIQKRGRTAHLPSKKVTTRPKLEQLGLAAL